MKKRSQQSTLIEMKLEKKLSRLLILIPLPLHSASGTRARLEHEPEGR